MSAMNCLTRLRVLALRSCVGGGSSCGGSTRTVVVVVRVVVVGGSGGCVEGRPLLREGGPDGDDSLRLLWCSCCWCPLGDDATGGVSRFDEDAVDDPSFDDDAPLLFVFLLLVVLEK